MLPGVSPLSVREARVADLGSIDRIYDHYVHTSTRDLAAPP